MHTYKLFITVAVAFLAAGCGQLSKPHKPESGVVYGQPFDTTQATPASRFAGQPVDQQTALVKGTVTKVCKAQGCWLKLDAGNGEELFVSTEDKFLVPKDGLVGKTVYVSGSAVTETTAVEELRAEAADQGKTAAEIDAITEPRTTVNVMARGVMVQ